MPNPNAPGQQKHKLHDMIEAHIEDWAKGFGITFDKHYLDEALRIGHVQKSLDLASGGNISDVTQLRQAIVFFGGFADFMLQHGATDPLVTATVEAMRELLS